jgi:hypothetical protein
MQSETVKKGLEPPEDDPGKPLETFRDKPDAKRNGPDRQGKEGKDVKKIIPPKENP